MRTQRWYMVPPEPVFAFADIWHDSEVLRFAFLTSDWDDARKLVEPFPSQLMAKTSMPLK